ncbi:5693_t:CDS:2, partial [Acaulospora colombiana]
MYAIANLHDSLSSRRRNSFSSPTKDSEAKPNTQPSSSTSSTPTYSGTKEKRKNNKKPQKKVSPDVQPQTYSSEKINEEIGLATQNATNLINALTLLGPNSDVENDLELQELVQKCKSSSEQLVKIISMVTEGNELGPLLQSNDQVQGALAAFSDCESGATREAEISSSTRGIENDGRNNKLAASRIHKDFDDLISLDSYSAANSLPTNGFIPDSSLLDDPFADPITPSRTPEPEP